MQRAYPLSMPHTYTSVSRSICTLCSKALIKGDKVRSVQINLYPYTVHERCYLESIGEKGDT